MKTYNCYQKREKTGEMLFGERGLFENEPMTTNSPLSYTYYRVEVGSEEDIEMYKEAMTAFLDRQKKDITYYFDKGDKKGLEKVADKAQGLGYLLGFGDSRQAFARLSKIS